MSWTYTADDGEVISYEVNPLELQVEALRGLYRLSQEELGKVQIENARLREAICEHEWFKWEPVDNMEQCRNCRLWKEVGDERH